MYGIGQLVADIVRAFIPDIETVREEYLLPDNNTVERMADVYLYGSAVDGVPSTTDGATQHWALVVHFEDDSFRTLEGRPNEGGYLHAHYSKQRGGRGLEELKKLGSVRTSPARLVRGVRDHPLNGTRYDLLDNNCQHWAVRAARDISEDVGRAAADTPRVTPALSVARDLAGALGFRAPFGMGS